MIDLRELTGQMRELRKVVDTVLKSTEYEEGEPLKVKFEMNSPDDLQLIEEYKSILYKLQDIVPTLDYLKRPIRFESSLVLRSDGRYGTVDGKIYYTSGSPIEFLYDTEIYDFEAQNYKAVQRWQCARVEYDGNDYYIVGYRNVSLNGLTIRAR